MLNLIKAYKSEFNKTKKSLGQHFLTNKHFISEIVSFLDLKEHDNVVEIGPGCGVLTYEILQKGVNLTVVDIDSDVCDFLSRYLYYFKNLKIINKDFIEITRDDLPDGKLKFAGNLPYNVSVKIFEKCVDFIDDIELMTFMFQKEVADRLTSEPCSKTYSSLSIFAQYYFNIEKIRNISGANFWPNTKVTSTVLKFIPRERYFNDLNKEKRFFDFVMSCFKSKRKTLKNNLSYLSKEQLEKIDKHFGEKIRAEQLSLDDFIKLFEMIENE
ncbi:dimethyladenosine transferase [Deferribacter desulfuricans SSM1]|uniref:Ribosomal RNA small subunit methyltransferase A n=1 Tax=Deferribacter desulfuricans (strain DSM 14783 / JCM 11476 / NBRC 101012 / SSM1) TaxID=639282 RepID=D3P9D8_DEFDS|nr:16S rRNA (adenine(1518)-N(6)/adenine(1519)-N(6))-dimethyltransferase RsmA [Deferribacter desulfuricans]BAI81328.1 dimethyladenosine transferase [Deferribacter desulfuricans SSM1]